MKFNDAFCKWFGDSKVVKNDRDRSPLLVYHGTPAKFYIFEQRDGTVATFIGVEKVRRTGFFFTTKRNVAQLFAGDKGHVMKCYLSIKKPADFTLRLRKLDDEIEREGVNLRWLNDYGDMWEKFDGDDGAMLVAALMRLGYDGAIIEEYIQETTETIKVYIAFHPSQIKSAENDGTWDSDDPDIRSNPRRHR